jgi:L-fuculose-phosphate aldolase
MPKEREKSLKDQIVHTGKILSQSGLNFGSSGNLSTRLDYNTMLITASGAPLANLKARDILRAQVIRKI